MMDWHAYNHQYIQLKCIREMSIYIQYFGIQNEIEWADKLIQNNCQMNSQNEIGPKLYQ